MADGSFAVENRVFDPDETMERETLLRLQAQRLREVVERTAAAVPFYRDGFRHAGVGPDDIRTVDDVRRLPFTTKSDLHGQYPLGLVTVPDEQIARIHGSSGTTGKPTFVAYTERDLRTWSGLCARFLVAGGLRPEHRAQIAFGYGLFTGGFGLHYGIERVGAGIVPAASGNTPRQVMLLKDLGVDVLICTPSYALNIAEFIYYECMNRKQFKLKYAHFGAEPWTEDMRRRIEQDLEILCFNNYGLSEVIGPGVSGECGLRQGMHISEDHFLAECIDPDTLEPVPDGTPGELVFTTLTKQAMPVIRYRTRDIASLDRSPCLCGRTGARMSRVTGRSDDMLIIRGVNVFPSQIEEALLRVEGTAPHYLIEVDRPHNLDTVKVQVEVRSSDLSSRVRDMHDLKNRIDREIQSITGLRMEVELVEPMTLERFVGKAVRVVDHRKNDA